MKRKLLKLLFIALALFVVGGICWLLVGITINFPPKSPLQRLTEARTLWQTKTIKNYQMDVIFGSMLFVGGYRIIVHDSQVTEVLEFPALYSNPPITPLKPDEEKLDSSNFFGKAISPNLKDYTVEKLFDIAAPKLETQPTSDIVALCMVDTPSPNVSFNVDYGYIQAYELSSCPEWKIGGGLLCPRIGDCYVGMRVRNFEILPPSQ